MAPTVKMNSSFSNMRNTSATTRGSIQHILCVPGLSYDSCITTLQGHTDAVNCLLVHNNILYSGSGDNTIRVWSLDTNECITALQGHTKWVGCLVVHNNILYSGSWDNTIRAWKL